MIWQCLFPPFEEIKKKLFCIATGSFQKTSCLPSTPDPAGLMSLLSSASCPCSSLLLLMFLSSFPATTTVPQSPTSVHSLATDVSPCLLPLFFPPAPPCVLPLSLFTFYPCSSLIPIPVPSCLPSPCYSPLFTLVPRCLLPPLKRSCLAPTPSWKSPLPGSYLG